MKKSIERNKTLLADGPAAITVAFGKVEVFGALMEGKSKILVREGKRLPLTAKEKAELDVCLGENGSLEEVEGSTISETWAEAANQILNLQAKPSTVMVVGPTDAGKSSLCTYIVNSLLKEKREVAVLDGDLGQSDIGPPGFVSYSFVTKPVTDLFALEAHNAFLVGVTSPSRVFEKVIKGLAFF